MNKIPAPPGWSRRVLQAVLVTLAVLSETLLWTVTGQAWCPGCFHLLKDEEMFTTLPHLRTFWTINAVSGETPDTKGTCCKCNLSPVKMCLVTKQSSRCHPSSIQNDTSLSYKKSRWDKHEADFLSTVFNCGCGSRFVRPRERNWMLNVCAQMNVSAWRSKNDSGMFIKSMVWAFVLRLLQSKSRVDVAKLLVTPSLRPDQVLVEKGSGFTL